jgi:hypothetical protein
MDSETRKRTVEQAKTQNEVLCQEKRAHSISTVIISGKEIAKMAIYRSTNLPITSLKEM